METLVRARVEQPPDVRELADPAAVSGMKTSLATASTMWTRVSRASDEAVMSRKASSSAPCSSVAPRDLNRIAGIHDVDEPDAFHHPSCIHVETRDDARRESHRR